MDNAIMQQVRLASPDGLPLSKIPEPLLADATVTARHVVEAIGKKQLDVYALTPDVSVPKTIPQWASLLAEIRKTRTSGAQLVLTIPHSKSVGASPEDIPDDDVAFPPDVVHLGDAYSCIVHLERLLRNIAHEALQSVDKNYESSHVSLDAYRDAALQVQEDERQALGELLSSRLIDYFEFGEILEVILANWKVCSKRFSRIEKGEFMSYKSRLPALRNAVMHGRLIGKPELREIQSIHHRVVKAVGQ